jgi:hypothetical protein
MPHLRESVEVFVKHLVERQASGNGFQARLAFAEGQCLPVMRLEGQLPQVDLAVALRLERAMEMAGVRGTQEAGEMEVLRLGQGAEVRAW